MKLAIVDDEALARARLRRMVADFPGWEVVAEAGDGATALEQIRRTEPDAVLLDIRMPGMDGLQVARALAAQPLPPAVIFTTAFSEHALSAYDTGAVGYLLKPVRAERLAQTLARARRPSRAQLQAAADGISAAGGQGYIHGNTRAGLVRVPVCDIVYFYADHKYTTVHHLHGELLIGKSLRALERDMGEDFVRVHRNALVAKRYVQELKRDCPNAGLVLRHAAEPVAVSRRRLAAVRALLEQDGAP